MTGNFDAGDRDDPGAQLGLTDLFLVGVLVESTDFSHPSKSWSTDGNTTATSSVAVVQP